MTSAKPKRIGWGALLNSVKEKKQKAEEEGNGKEVRHKKTKNSPNEKPTTKSSAKEQGVTKPTKADQTKETASAKTKQSKPNNSNNSNQQQQPDKKPTKNEPKIERTAEAKEGKKDSTSQAKNNKRTHEETTYKTNGVNAKKTKVEKEELEKNNKSNEKTKTEKETRQKDNKHATPSPKSILKTARKKGQVEDEDSNKKKVEHQVEEEGIKVQKEDRMKKYTPAYDKEEAERRNVEKEKFENEKKSLRGLLGTRKFFDFSVDSPLVVYLHPEKKQGEHDFYMNLLAKSYARDYSDSITYKATKMVLGFDVEYRKNLPLTIQLSSNTLSLVFNLFPPNATSPVQTLSPSLSHLFASANYIKCGVGVPLDMGALRNHFSISLEGMFDISFFAVDMQLTKVPWALEVFGMDLLSVGKVNMFSAKSATLNDIQIEYAARDAWIGYKVTEYFFGYFGTRFASIHSWARAYSQRRQSSLDEASKNESLPKMEDNQSEDDQSEDDQSEDNESQDGEDEESEESDEVESDEEDNQKKKKKQIKGQDKKDNKTTKSTDSKIDAAISKGMALAKQGQAKDNMTSNQVKGIRHRIRNKLESLKAQRRKSEIEEDTFASLVERMANKTAEKGDTEDMGTVFNWV